MRKMFATIAIVLLVFCSFASAEEYITKGLAPKDSFEANTSWGFTNNSKKLATLCYCNPKGAIDCTNNELLGEANINCLPISPGETRTIPRDISTLWVGCGEDTLADYTGKKLVCRK